MNKTPKARPHLDLSFLDEEVEVQPPNNNLDFSGLDDHALQRSIIALRQNYNDLNAGNLKVLEVMTAEYISRGKIQYRLFSAIPMEKDTQVWLWGREVISSESKLEGVKIANLAWGVEFDSNTDCSGYIYIINHRQLRRSDDFLSVKGLRRTKAVQDEKQPNGANLRREIQVYVPAKEVAKV